MLQLQAQTLEQQERLYKNQIRLNIREIMQGELNFYASAFANISSTASILGVGDCTPVSKCLLQRRYNCVLLFTPCHPTFALVSRDSA